MLTGAVVRVSMNMIDLMILERLEQDTKNSKGLSDEFFNCLKARFAKHNTPPHSGNE